MLEADARKLTLGQRVYVSGRGREKTNGDPTNPLVVLDTRLNGTVRLIASQVAVVDFSQAADHKIGCDTVLFEHLHLEP